MQDVQTTLPVGTIIRDRYNIKGLLGKGGFGAVYLVSDLRVRGNLFALKELVDSSKKERDRFAFECEVLKRLDHPSLPKVYRVFEDDANNRAYMLMDYIEGPNLETLRRRQPDKRFSLAQALNIMTPIINAVSYLHSQHPPIIHRDIKPANIIVPADDDHAMLVDFGIAKEYDPESTTTAIRRCSPGYGAPEQYSTGTNPRTDIYGLAATLYAILTGTVPADALFRMTQMGNHGVDPLEPVTYFVPSIPAHIADAIQRAMSININDRYPTVEEFWQAVHDGQEEQAAAAPIIAPLPASKSPNTPLPVNIERVTTVPFGDHAVTTLAQRRRGKVLPLAIMLIVFLAIAAGVVAALLLPALLNNSNSSSHTPPPVGAAHHGVTATATKAPTTAPTAAPTQASKPAATTTPSPPTSNSGVSGTYIGQAHNTNSNQTANMTITFQERQGNLTGYVTIDQPLIGSGSIINGFVQNNGNLHFTVQSYRGNAPLYFWGTVSSNGNAQGQYCSLDRSGHCNASAGGQGTWNASPANSGSSYVPSPGAAVAVTTENALRFRN